MPDPPLPWLYAVARKTLANERRKRERSAALPLDPTSEPEPAGDPVLAAAFAQLNDADREVLRLVAWEGLAAREAAVVLGCSAAVRADPPRTRPRRRLVLALAVVALPAAAFAGKLAGVLGLSNQGTPVATDSLSLMQATKLAEAVHELDVPMTLHLLGSRDGISFYVARRADGDYCFALESDAGKGVGCDFTGTFPSAQRQVFVFPPFRQFAGFAADGIATVAGLDASGGVVASARVVDNLFAVGQSTDAVVSLEALDAKGPRSLGLAAPRAINRPG